MCCSEILISHALCGSFFRLGLARKKFSLHSRTAGVAARIVFITTVDEILPLQYLEFSKPPTISVSMYQPLRHRLQQPGLTEASSQKRLVNS